MSIRESSGLPGGEEQKALELYRAQLVPEVFTKPYEPPRTDASGDIRNNLRDTERWLALDRKLPDLLSGKAKPANPQEQLEFAYFCVRYKELPHTAARFFADAGNLALANPPGARLSWLAPPPPLCAGAVLDFKVRVLGVPVRWRVMIREFDRPYRFVDVQLQGPFARWEHRHRFVVGAPDAGDAGMIGTWVKDRVTYRLPLGPLGHLAHGLAAGRQINGLFDYRERRLRELLC